MIMLTSLLFTMCGTDGIKNNNEQVLSYDETISLKNMSYNELYCVNVWSSYNTIKYYYSGEGYDGKTEIFTRNYYLSTDFKKTNEWLNNNINK